MRKLAAILLCLTSGLAHSEVDCGALMGDVWAGLRARGQLASLADIVPNTNLCSQVCSVELIQAVAEELGLPIPPSKATIESLLADQTETANGRNPSQIKETLVKILSETFPHRNISVHAKILSGTITPKTPDLEVVANFTPVDFGVGPGRYKLLLTAQLDENNDVVFEHSQIVRAFEQGAIHLIEPASPAYDLVVEPQNLLWVGESLTPRLVYVGPDRPKKIKHLLVYGVISVTVPNSGARTPNH